MKKQTTMVLAISALMLAGCGQPSVPKAEANYCKDLVALKQALVELANITPNSKVGDVKKAQANVDKALANLKTSTADVKEAKVDAVEKAYDDLDKTIKKIPNRDTLAQAAATVKPKVDAVEAARAQLQTQVNCNP